MAMQQTENTAAPEPCKNRSGGAEAIAKRSDLPLAVYNARLTLPMFRVASAQEGYMLCDWLRKHRTSAQVRLGGKIVVFERGEWRDIYTVTGVNDGN